MVDARQTQAFERARAAIAARMAGDLVYKISIKGETTERVSHGNPEWVRAVWRSDIAVEEYGHAPCQFTVDDEGWMEFATEVIARRLVARTRILGDDCETLFFEIQKAYAELREALT